MLGKWSVYKWTNNPEKLNSWDKQVRVVDKFGNVRFLRNGKLHRDGDLPAVMEIDGSKEWYKNGLAHRDGDEPAVIYPGFYKAWAKNGHIHRDGDLPAIEHEDGRKAWYKNGIFMGRTLDAYREWSKRNSNENI